MRDQDHDPLARTVSYHAHQQFDAGRVHPLDVLDDHQDRPLARGRDENIDDHLKSTLALGGRSKIRRLVFPSRPVSTAALRSSEVRARHRGQLLPKASAILPMRVPRRRLPGCRSRASAARFPGQAACLRGTASTACDRISRGDASRELRNWRIRRDLPMPGSPEMTPTCPDPATLCCHISASNALSPVRSIIGARGDLRALSNLLSLDARASTRQASTGSSTPLSDRLPSGA